MEKRFNENWEIIGSVQFDGRMKGYEIVLGRSENNKCTPYVTWEYRQDTNSYYWGHYCTTYEGAYSDFTKRIMESVKYSKK